jgi:hypothetical protein
MYAATARPLLASYSFEWTATVHLSLFSFVTTMQTATCRLIWLRPRSLRLPRYLKLGPRQKTCIHDRPVCDGWYHRCSNPRPSSLSKSRSSSSSRLPFSQDGVSIISAPVGEIYHLGCGVFHSLGICISSFCHNRWGQASCCIDGAKA